MTASKLTFLLPGFVQNFLDEIEKFSVKAKEINFPKAGFATFGKP